MSTFNRLAALTAVIQREGLDALLVSSLPNIRYLSGFTGSAARLLVTASETYLFIDFRYRIQAQRQARYVTRVEVKSNDALDEIARYIRQTGSRRLGFEERVVSYHGWYHMRAALKGICKLVPAGSLVEGLRMIKSAAEIRLIRRAARMADRVLELWQRKIRVGMTEQRASVLLQKLVLDAGAGGMAFEPVIASGARSAMPHHHAGRGRITAKGPLLVDFGCTVNGYNCDLTRTFSLGRVSPRFRKIYRTVMESQHAALEGIREGVSAREVDQRARDIISAHGYGEFFGHGLGHGVGLEVHEAPRVSHSSAGVLKEGMVFTVEPGIYLPGWGGVRIEDVVVVEEKRCRLLSNHPKGIEVCVI